MFLRCPPIPFTNPIVRVRSGTEIPGFYIFAIKAPSHGTLLVFSRPSYLNAPWFDHLCSVLTLSSTTLPNTEQQIMSSHLLSQGQPERADSQVCCQASCAVSCHCHVQWHKDRIPSLLTQSSQISARTFTDKISWR